MLEGGREPAQLTGDGGGGGVEGGGGCGARGGGGGADTDEHQGLQTESTRRTALASALMGSVAIGFSTVGALLAPAPASAKLELVFDGEAMTAYAFAVPLNVVALRG